MEHFWTYLEGIYIKTDNNYKLLIVFQRFDVYLSDPIKIDELIKLANQRLACGGNAKITATLIFECRKLRQIFEAYK